MLTVSFWYCVLECVSFPIALFCVFSFLFLRIFVVEGLSMHPTLVEGDYVLVLRYWPAFFLRRNQIVVCIPPVSALEKRNIQLASNENSFNYCVWHTEPGFYVKRVVGLPGDQVFVLDYPHQGSQSHLIGCHEFTRICKVPVKHFFVKGDNRGLDSTVWGAIPFDSLYGVVIKRFDPKYIMRSLKNH